MVQRTTFTHTMQVEEMMVNESLILELSAKNYTELCIFECGREKCAPIKDIVSFKKNWYVFHYVLYGKGVYEYNGKSYNLSKGNMFFIPKNVEAHYYPDKNEPWIYAWLGFDGRFANKFLELCGLSENSPIYKDKGNFSLKDSFNHLVDNYNYAGFLDLKCLACAYEIMGTAIANVHTKSSNILSAKESHIKEAIQYIENNYQFEISIADIADSINITSNYLSNIFSEVLSTSPKQYLTKYRMEKACRLLTDKTSRIKDVAEKVGYKNQLHFSAEFKKTKFISPLQYKKDNTL